MDRDHQMRRSRSPCWRSVCAALLLASLASASSAQERLWYAESDEYGKLFGLALDLCADADGDGIPDLIIGAPGADCASTDDGSTSVVSLAGGELHLWCGSQDSLGISV